MCFSSIYNVDVVIMFVKAINDMLHHECKITKFKYFILPEISFVQQIVNYVP